MKRRSALKNMGMAMGLTVATPTVLSLLQSCQQETGPDWTPVFFSPEEGAVLVQVVDLILPKTDIPSASEVGVHSFLDLYMAEVSAPEEQAMIKTGLAAFIKQALSDSGKETAADLTPEDLEPVLAAALVKREPDDEAAIYEALGAYMEAQAKGEAATLDDAVGTYLIANNLREASIWAFKNSEYIGEEVLAYLPVPGEYIGCGDLNELTGGKAWSIVR